MITDCTVMMLLRNVLTFGLRLDFGNRDFVIVRTSASAFITWQKWHTHRQTDRLTQGSNPSFCLLMRLLGRQHRDYPQSPFPVFVPPLKPSLSLCHCVCYCSNNSTILGNPESQFFRLFFGLLWFLCSFRLKETSTIPYFAIHCGFARSIENYEYWMGNRQWLRLKTKIN